MKKDAGFGVVGIVVIVVAILIVGVAAWRIYEVNKGAPVATNNGQTEDPSQMPTETATYLDIKELGVRIKLDDNTKDVTYSVAPNSGSEAVFVIDQTMKALDVQQCPGNETPGMIGLLDRSKNANHWGETPTSVDNEKAFKIGEYYYLFREPQAECSQNEQTSEKRADQIKVFLNVLKTIKSISS